VALGPEFQTFAQANRGIRRLVQQALAAILAALTGRSLDDVKAALLDALPGLVAQYGDVAATVAADFYDQLRASSGAKGAFTAVLADPASAAQVQASIKAVIGPMYTAQDPQAVAGVLSTTLDRYVLQVGRDTITASAAKDPGKPSWARVPQGDTCAFCIMLASRGAVYGSAAAAGQMHAYHGDCDCTPTPIWPGQPLPDGYDPDALMRQYLDGRAAAGSGNLKKILAGMRDAVPTITH
jgi:hypothetical protein